MAISRTSRALILHEYGPWAGVDAVHGVTCDGARIWFAAGDRLLAIDLVSGKPVASLDVDARAGTAFDGEYLYQVGKSVIRKLLPSTGAVVMTIPIQGDAPVSGLAWSDGSLWLGRNHDRRIERVDPDSGEVLRSIDVARVVTGVTWDGAELWHGSWEKREAPCAKLTPKPAKRWK